MQLRFSKYEGTANDFIVVDECDASSFSLERVKLLCDRHRGIGADGVLIVRSMGSAVHMTVRNADGSDSEMCGNGLRCVAWHLVRTGRKNAGERFDVETAAGPHACVVYASQEGSEVAIEMRAPMWEPSAVPVLAHAPMIDEVFDVDGRHLALSAVSMGNPHAVTFDDVGESRFSLGPRMSADPRFPSGANVGFARMTAGDQMNLFVFERGAGWTQACGTGACAAAAAAVETGRAPRGVSLTVVLPGGPLQIIVGSRGERIRMRGPARHIYDGTIEDDRL